MRHRATPPTAPEVHVGTSALGGPDWGESATGALHRSASVRVKLGASGCGHAVIGHQPYYRERGSLGSMEAREARMVYHDGRFVGIGDASW